jgi:hypothetical protein
MAIFDSRIYGSKPGISVMPLQLPLSFESYQHGSHSFNLETDGALVCFIRLLSNRLTTLSILILVGNVALGDIAESIVMVYVVVVIASFQVVGHPIVTSEISSQADFG